MTFPSGRLDMLDLPLDAPFKPRISQFTARFWSELSERSLVSTRCTACGRLSFPPKPICRFCWHQEMEWVSLPPEGKLYSFTTVRVPPRAFNALAPYSVGIVDLDVGLRLTCSIVGRPQQNDLDGRVRMVGLRYRDFTLFGARISSGDG